MPRIADPGHCSGKRRKADNAERVNIVQNAALSKTPRHGVRFQPVPGRLPNTPFCGREHDGFSRLRHGARSPLHSLNKIVRQIWLCPSPVPPASRFCSGLAKHGGRPQHSPDKVSSAARCPKGLQGACTIRLSGRGRKGDGRTATSRTPAGSHSQAATTP